MKNNLNPWKHAQLQRVEEKHQLTVKGSWSIFWKTCEKFQYLYWYDSPPYFWIMMSVNHVHICRGWRIIYRVILASTYWGCRYIYDNAPSCRLYVVYVGIGHSVTGQSRRVLCFDCHIVGVVSVKPPLSVGHSHRCTGRGSSHHTGFATTQGNIRLDLGTPRGMAYGLREDTQL